MSKRVFIKTYGCQMNVYDSARMADALAPIGFVPVDDPEQADLIILNTCHIREKAAEKVYSELGRLRRLKQRPAAAGGPVLLAVAGCVAQAEGAEILDRAPYVDMVFGPQSLHRLPEMIARVSRGAGQALETDFPVEGKFDLLPEASAPASGVAAFLTVQEGCDKFCTFCVVPYTRGAEFSRPAADVLAEAGRYAAAGVREITLLGQNVNAYHGAAADGGEWRLARLIAAIAEVPGIERIRYTTSHPTDMTEDLIAAHRDIDQLMPYLHLPVQSGSDRVLRAMGRRHSADDYRRLVDRLRRARPDLALSSDFIVGFPGESDADFQDTLDLAAEVEFAQAYSFKYSPRPGTPAAGAAQLDEAVKRDRLSQLQALLDAQQQAFNHACVGEDLPVLFDRPGRHPGQVLGRSPYMQAVHVNAPASVLGTVQGVRIISVAANSLAGTLKERAVA
ncbi:MAG: tRNA (N6-isopentenyl adenosine(37)-C2)-methylthiotransferase MiaB [Rhodospirillales bacterium]|nr:MAG: tRNA (N6-isopentenyl adenosine(37)-C2)-methylthiotransferase MiaB [Rhodospirillales bacterium]